MTLAIFRVMLLGLVRDRGALAMAFVLPPLIYLIFASIFAGAAGDELQLRIAVLDEVQSPVTQRLTSAILADPAMRIVSTQPGSRSAVEQLVRQDHADAGIVIAADPSLSATAPNASPILIFGDPAKAMASASVAGQVQRVFSEKMPDAAYQRVLADFEKSILPFTPEQRTRANGIIEFIAKSRQPGASAGLKDAVNQRATPPLVSLLALGGSNHARAAVVYYAGAVAILFLMYSALHSAVSLIDERQNGIMDRILQGASGVTPVLAGKFLFLVAQGVVQVALIFVVASLLYGVEVWHKWFAWLLITLAAAGATAALALALAAACHTRHQAQTLSTFLVLVLAALGGSMVPQFLMPGWLQQLSWAIPNAWIIEAYHRLLWRDAPLAELLPILWCTVVFTLTMLGVAFILLRPARLTRA
jgi:ABC-2 type transport system permease protein